MQPEQQGQVPMEEKRDVDFEVIKGQLYQIVNHQLKNLDNDEWITVKREVLPIPFSMEKSLEEYAKQRAELLKRHKEQLDEFDAQVDKLKKVKDNNGQKDSSS